MTPRRSVASRTRAVSAPVSNATSLAGARFLGALLATLAACGDDDAAPVAPPQDASEADTSDVSDAPGDVGEDAASDVVVPDAAPDTKPDVEPELPEDVGDGADTPHDVDDASDATDVPDLPDVPVGQTAASALEPGPWSVGFRRMETEFTLVGDEAPRVLPIAVWYPTVDVGGDTPRYQNLLRRREIWLDAEPVGDDPLPVLVFSHGNESFAEQSFFMTEFFASHGWLVVAPDHVGNRAFDDEKRGDALVFRPQDVVATLDALETLDADDPLAGRAGEDVVMTGHSFGGFTSLALGGARFDSDRLRAVCAESDRFPLHRCDAFSEEELDWLDGWEGDARVRLIIPQTPGGLGFFAEDGVESVEVPTLLMTGARDRTTTDEAEGDPIWEAIEAEGSLRASFAEAGHFTFSNMCTAVPGVFADDGCGETFMDALEAQFTINALSLAFARERLGLPGPVGEAAAILSGAVELSDSVELESR